MKTYEVSSVMYLELMSCNATETIILNSNSLFGFTNQSFGAGAARSRPFWLEPEPEPKKILSVGSGSSSGSGSGSW